VDTQYDSQQQKDSGKPIITVFNMVLKPSQEKYITQ
jgi:hypothetical protein